MGCTDGDIPNRSLGQCNLIAHIEIPEQFWGFEFPFKTLNKVGDGSGVIA
jgi:hypothetical protein